MTVARSSLMDLNYPMIVIGVVQLFFFSSLPTGGLAQYSCLMRTRAWLLFPLFISFSCNFSVFWWLAIHRIWRQGSVREYIWQMQQQITILVSRLTAFAQSAADLVLGSGRHLWSLQFLSRKFVEASYIDLTGIPQSLQSPHLNAQENKILLGL